MLFAKHCITSSAGLLGGVFGYVTASSDLVALLSAFGFMFACAFMADLMTMQLEEDEDDEPVQSATPHLDSDLDYYRDQIS